MLILLLRLTFSVIFMLSCWDQLRKDIWNIFQYIPFNSLLLLLLLFSKNSLQCGSRIWRNKHDTVARRSCLQSTLKIEMLIFLMIFFTFPLIYHTETVSQAYLKDCLFCGAGWCRPSITGYRVFISGIFYIFLGAWLFHCFTCRSRSVVHIIFGASHSTISTKAILFSLEPPIMWGRGM